MEPQITIENWSISGEVDPYLAPEVQDFRLIGKVFNHPKYSYIDGYDIKSSRIIRIDMEKREIETVSGTIYHLGVPGVDYVKWLKDTGQNIPAWFLE